MDVSPKKIFHFLRGALHAAFPRGEPSRLLSYHWWSRGRIIGAISRSWFFHSPSRNFSADALDLHYHDFNLLPNIFFAKIAFSCRFNYLPSCLGL